MDVQQGATVEWVLVDREVTLEGTAWRKIWSSSPCFTNVLSLSFTFGYI